MRSYDGMIALLAAYSMIFVLSCPKCSAHMRIISVIEDLAIVKKILIHLNLGATKNHEPPIISLADKWVILG